MSYSISTLLPRNLQDVFGEGDPQRRRTTIDEIYTEDVVFYDPNKAVYCGRDEIDRIAGAIRATHSDFSYQPIAEPEEVGDGGRVRWVAGRPGEAPAYAGTDFIFARDGRIAAIYLFFDKLSRTRPHPFNRSGTSIHHEENRVPLIRPLDAFAAVANPVGGGRPPAVD